HGETESEGWVPCRNRMGQRLASILKAVMQTNVSPAAPLHPKFGELDPTRPERLEELLRLGPAPPSVQSENGWSPDDCSSNISIKEGGHVLRRHPVAQSTDVARGRRGYSWGLHVWEITWLAEERGTHAVVGVATDQAPLQAEGYTALVGSNSESWGWDIGHCQLHHESKVAPCCPYPARHGSEEHIQVPDSFLVVLDMDEGTLGYSVNGQYLGIAFRGLKGKKLYPAVSAVWGQCKVAIRYFGGLQCE
uniref:SplA/ryanodine receptor domain and SOCS box containing 2 n=1 Tax=Latimeria chalumnae TaxID=7897 RepID=H3A9L7_LATCH